MLMCPPATAANSRSPCPSRSSSLSFSSRRSPYSSILTSSVFFFRTRLLCTPPGVLVTHLYCPRRIYKMLVRIIFIFVFILHFNFTGLFNGTWSNNQSLDNSVHNSTSAQKAGEDDWGESSFLGAAVGILVTVVLAAISAIILVLVRNRRQKKCLSELAHFNNMNTGTSSSIQSSLTSKHYLLE